MQSRESEIPNFDLPEEVLAVLPSDPFEQLDVARKITSIALATRVSKLESEVSWLRREMNEKEELIAGLQSQIESLDASLDESNQKFTRVEDEKENLLKENSLLQSTVKKLNRDVSKLEVFRKTLMQSLREEEDNSQAGISKVKQIQDSLDSPSGPEEEDYSSPTPKSLSVPAQPSTPENSLLKDGYVADTVASKTESLRSLKLGSQNITPRLTPPPSPPRVSTTASPTKWSNPVSPRRHSISFSYSRSNDNRSFKSPSTPPNQQNSLDTGYQPGRNRVDGKEFFRQVRSRLSYEQFAAFLANVKELNAHKQTKEETLLKANEIFGPDNKDLYAIFESLITRNLQ